VVEKGISVVIPAYNEEYRIKKSLDSYVPVLLQKNLPFEIIIITDGTDRTADVVNSYNNPAIKVFSYSYKLGKGGAIREGQLKAKYDLSVWIDADGSLHPDDLSKMLNRINECDCVIASRWLEGSIWLEKEPLFNRTVGRVFNFLVRSILLLPLADTQCGAKIVRTDVAVESLRSTVVTNRTFDVAVLYHIKKAGYLIKEVPVTWRHDRDTRMPIFRVIPIMLMTLLGIRLMDLPIRKLFPDSVVDYFRERYAKD